MICIISVLGGIGVGLGVYILRLWRKVRKKEELFLAEKELAGILMRNVHAFILLIDVDFIVVQTNYYTLTQTKDTARPKRIGELLRCRNALDAGECGGHLDCAHCPVRKAIEHSFRKQENFRDLEVSMTIYTDDCQHTLDCELMVSGAWLELKKKAYLLLTLYDITQLKQIQRELLSAKEQAEQADRLKSAFLANMSHEIRTPLNAIIGFSELMASADEGERAKYLKIITKNNDILLQLINNILDVSKIEAGTLDFNFTEVDINQLLWDVYESFRRKEESNLQLEFECHPGLEKCTIFTEKKRVTQLLSNLISNALKFTTEGYVHFGYEWREKEIFFYVKDSGIGISEDDQERLFQRFTKLNRIKPGFGLGLYINKVIVEKLGGRMGVESESDNGSLFWFVIPVTEVEKKSRGEVLPMD